MNYQTNTPTLRSTVEQTNHNATSWIGHRHFDNKDVIAGQTFIAPSEADIEAIEVFPTVVTKPGKLQMTVYDFDEQKNQWGASLGTAIIDINRESNGKWVPFNLKGLHLNKGKSYGFKIESNDTYIGVGEAAGSAKQPPYDNGREWRFENNQPVPNSYRYFSLAFKIDVKAA
ncbi:MAG: hypothetical protein QM687_11735 [Ferruginibacter sp.]